MGSIGTGTSSASSNNVSIEVREYWGNEEITSYDNAEIEKDINQVKRVVQDVLEEADNNIDRAYDYLADNYPFHLYDDEATKIIDNRDEHNIIAVDIRMREDNGKVKVTLSPRVFDESDFNTQEELDAMGLYERRRR